MLDRLADWLDRQPPQRRRLYSTFIAVTLLTLPCYAAGVLMLVLSDPNPQHAVPTQEPPSIVSPVPDSPGATADVPVPTPIERRASDTPPAQPTRLIIPTLENVVPAPTFIVVTLTAEMLPPTDTPAPTTTTVPPTVPPAATDTPPPPAATATRAAIPIVTEPPIILPPVLTPRP